MNISPAYPFLLRAQILLPASKSISARALAIHHLSGGGFRLRNLSCCDDTQALRSALAELPELVDIGAAGTAMRFLTAVLALTEGQRTLTGTARMKQRPIGTLVDALRSLGAEIGYEQAEGYPPLRIAGRQLRGGSVALAAGVSSQFVSALLLIAPCLQEGLRLRLEGEAVSRPYIEMTLRLMRRFGAEAGWLSANELRVAPKPYAPKEDYSVEADWSAASYWYEMVALSSDPEARICLPLLEEESLQGDSRVSEFFRPLGVQTNFENGVAVLTKCSPTAGTLEFDLCRQPDLAQTLVVACALLQRAFRFTGLQSLRIKETDRLAALRTELGKLGYAIRESGGDTLSWDGRMQRPLSLEIDTYEDHRMAMAFAPAALRFPGIVIRDAGVVSKSYPSFWDDLERIGAQLEIH